MDDCFPAAPGWCYIRKDAGHGTTALGGDILPWVPSVVLAEINRAAFLESVPITQVLFDLWVVITVSLPLYALVIWKVRRSDR